jgi:hypothetical protein
MPTQRIYDRDRCDAFDCVPFNPHTAAQISVQKFPNHVMFKIALPNIANL